MLKSRLNQPDGHDPESRPFLEEAPPPAAAQPPSRCAAAAGLHRALHARISTCVAYLLCFVTLVQFFATYATYNFDHVPRDLIKYELYMEVNPKLVQKDLPLCEYDKVLISEESLDPRETSRMFDEFSARGVLNGSHAPAHCRAAISVAVLVTYRNRQSQLDVFLPYIHNFLRKQNIHYKIYVIEQQDDTPWNKGLLYNIGAKLALAEKFPCLILHDVDMLPLDLGNLYACLRSPRHMSGSLDKYRYVLPYSSLVGGALSIRADHYTAVDGLSNRFLYWGGEDDDFERRLREHGLKVLRFPRQLSRYTMLAHPAAPRNDGRARVMADNERRRRRGRRRDKDGLTTVTYRSMAVTPHRLFTLIRVKL